MRPHGHATVNARLPRAWGVCDRCGALYEHRKLAWQFDYSGPRLFNKRILVCPSCMDRPQENLRTIVLPPDPVPIQNPRPEQYAADDNPISPVGQAPPWVVSPVYVRGTDTGTLQNSFRAFDSNLNKPFSQCAGVSISNLGLANTIGKNWNRDPSRIQATMPTTNTITHTVSRAVMQAPNDMAFLLGQPMQYLFQGSSDALNWTTLASGTTQGTIGETVTITSFTGGPYAHHRLVMEGDGVNPLGIAQLAISVQDAAPPPL